MGRDEDLDTVSLHRRIESLELDLANARAACESWRSECLAAMQAHATDGQDVERLTRERDEAREVLRECLPVLGASVPRDIDGLRSRIARALGGTQ